MNFWKMHLDLKQKYYLLEKSCSVKFIINNKSNSDQMGHREKLQPTRDKGLMLIRMKSFLINWQFHQSKKKNLQSIQSLLYSMVHLQPYFKLPTGAQQQSQLNGEINIFFPTLTCLPLTSLGRFKNRMNYGTHKRMTVYLYFTHSTLNSI